MVVDPASFLSTAQMRKIGLKPREEFLRDRAQELIEKAKESGFGSYHPLELDDLLRFRGTGRTTSMQLQALKTILGGHSVLMRAHTETYAGTLRRELRDWCGKLGFDQDLVLMGEPRTAPRGMKIFQDHYQGG